MLPRRAVVALTRPATRQRHFATTPARALSPLTNVSHSPVFIKDVNQGQVIPAFRVLDGEGNVLPDVPQEWRDKANAIKDETLLKMYTTMSIMPQLDTILSSAQRQGRISFYMTSAGEEGGELGRVMSVLPSTKFSHRQLSSDPLQHGRMILKCLRNTVVS